METQIKCPNHSSNDLNLPAYLSEVHIMCNWAHWVSRHIDIIMLLLEIDLKNDAAFFCQWSLGAQRAALYSVLFMTSTSSQNHNFIHHCWWTVNKTRHASCMLYPAATAHLKQQYVTLTSTCGFKKRNSTVHITTTNSNSSKTGSFFYRENFLWFSLWCPATALPQLCDSRRFLKATYGLSADQSCSCSSG